MAQKLTPDGLEVGLFVDELATAEPEVEAEKPLYRMNTAELEALAAGRGIDLSDCKNNRERAEKLK